MSIQCMRFFGLFMLFHLMQSTRASAEEAESCSGRGLGFNAEVICEIQVKHDYYHRLLVERNQELYSFLEALEFETTGVREAVEAQHIAWLDYYTTECHLLSRLNPSYSYHTSQCQASLIDRRYRRVNRAVKCLKRETPPPDRPLGLERCLYQLTHLALEQ